MENVRYLKNKKIMLYLKLTFCLGNLLTFSLSNNSLFLIIDDPALSASNGR